MWRTMALDLPSVVLHDCSLQLRAPGCLPAEEELVPAAKEGAAAEDQGEGQQALAESPM
jgi:hypothetical protein